MATETRVPLSRDRIIQAAIAFADRNGIAGLSMRKLGAELGVEAMSLYNHISDKEDILNGMIDQVFQSIPLPDLQLDWRDAIRQGGIGAVETFTAHPWVLEVLGSRGSTRPAALAFMERALAILSRAGFSDSETHHAWQLIASQTIGYAFQQITSPGTANFDAAAFEAWIAREGEHHPTIVRLAPLIVECDFDYEYEFGLDVIIAGLEARLR